MLVVAPGWRGAARPANTTMCQAERGRHRVVACKRDHLR